MCRTTLPRLVLAVTLCAPGQVRAQTVNPFDGDPAAIRAGSALYANRCAECHGADAKGFSGPDLTLLWEYGTDDEAVFETIRTGVSGSMPSFPSPANETWATVAYVKSVSTVSPFESTSGDAERGRELFESTCMSCHRVNGRGGGLGPDLTRVAVVRTRETVGRAIREPDAAVSTRYRAVTLVPELGDAVRGIRKGEDAFSIQIMDLRGRLRGFLKESLVEVRREESSLMPAFGLDRLDESQLDDLLRYLGSLREVDRDRP